MTTTYELPKLEIISSLTATSPSARFTVGAHINGPTMLDGSNNTSTTRHNIEGGVVWIDRRASDFKLELEFPAGSQNQSVVCTRVDDDEVEITPTWDANHRVATLTLLFVHVSYSYAITCEQDPSAAIPGPDGVSFTVRVRRGTIPVDR